MNSRLTNQAEIILKGQCNIFFTIWFIKALDHEPSTLKKKKVMKKKSRTLYTPHKSSNNW